MATHRRCRPSRPARLARLAIDLCRLQHVQALQGLVQSSLDTVIFGACWSSPVLVVLPSLERETAFASSQPNGCTRCELVWPACSIPRTGCGKQRITSFRPSFHICDLAFICESAEKNTAACISPHLATTCPAGPTFTVLETESGSNLARLGSRCLAPSPHLESPPSFDGRLVWFLAQGLTTFWTLHPGTLSSFFHFLLSRGPSQRLFPPLLSPTLDVPFRLADYLRRPTKRRRQPARRARETPSQRRTTSTSPQSFCRAILRTSENHRTTSIMDCFDTTQSPISRPPSPASISSELDEDDSQYSRRPTYPPGRLLTSPRGPSRLVFRDVSFNQGSTVQPDVEKEGYRQTLLETALTALGENVGSLVSSGGCSFSDGACIGTPRECSKARAG